MINSILSPKIDSGPVAPSTPIHEWPLGYGYIYILDNVGSWDFTSDGWVNVIYNWNTDREGSTRDSLYFNAQTRIISLAAGELLPTTHTLAFRHKGYLSGGAMFTVGSSFGSNIYVYNTAFGYNPAYMQGGTISITNNTSTYYDWVIVRTGATAQIYRNAVYIGQLTGMTTAFTLSRITNFVGQMDFVNLYDYALSQNEIDYIYQN